MEPSTLYYLAIMDWITWPTATVCWHYVRLRGSRDRRRDIGGLFSIRPSLGLVAGVLKPLALRLWNTRPRRLARQRHAMVFDGVYLWKPTWIVQSWLRKLGYYYYGVPEEHVAQVEAAGFDVVAMYDVAGREVPSEEASRRSTDRWLHYLCRRRG